MSAPDRRIFFGPAGNLRRLYNPHGGMLATRVMDTSVFTTGTGGARTNKLLNGVRTYTLNYQALGRENWEYLNRFQQGLMGTGPFVLIDPGRRNLLTPNQSGCCSLTNDTTDFTVSGPGGSISADNSLTVDFPRTLKWSFATTTPATAALTLNKPSRVWPGFPVVPNRFYTFWGIVLGGVGTISFALTIKWMDLAGNPLGTVNGPAVASSITQWQGAFVTAMPPANAAWVECGVAVTLATVASGESLYFSAFQLQEGDAPDSTFSVGTGVYPVTVLSLPETYGFAEPGMLTSPVLTLQEVK